MDTEAGANSSHENEASERPGRGGDGNYSLYEKHQRLYNWIVLPLSALTLITLFGGVWVAKATLESIDASVIQAGHSAAAAARGAAAAEGALNVSKAGMEGQQSLIETSRQQMSLMVRQIEDARDALRLEQRPWLGYVGFTLEARADSDEPWGERVPREGDEVRVRMRILNTGRTPAILIPLNSANPRLAPVDTIAPPPPEWRPVSETQGRVVVLPGVEGRRQYTRPFRLSEEQFRRYSADTHWLLLWARMNYCDAAQRRHWVQVAIAHRSSNPPNLFHTPSVSISPDPGEPDHADCLG